MKYTKFNERFVDVFRFTSQYPCLLSFQYSTDCLLFHLFVHSLSLKRNFIATRIITVAVT